MNNQLDLIAVPVSSEESNSGSIVSDIGAALLR